MKITVWNGCSVLAELEFAGDGPNIDLDPKNMPEQIVVRRGNLSRIMSLENPKGKEGEES